MLLDVALVPLAARADYYTAEIPIPDNAVVVGSLVRETDLHVEVHYTWDPAEGPTILPRRVRTSVGAVGQQITGARHLVTYAWLNQLWHVFVEVDEE